MVTNRNSRLLRFTFWAAALLSVVHGCYGDGDGPNRTIASQKADASGSSTAGPDASVLVKTPGDLDASPPVLDVATSSDPPVLCDPLKSSEPLRARSTVISGAASGGDRAVSVSDLYSQFKTYCGACHVEQALGGFKSTKVSLANFSDLVDSDATGRIRSNDPSLVMPQGGPIWSKRSANDPIAQLADLLEKWIAAGRPRDVFFVTGSSEVGSLYKFSNDLAQALTNIGNCLPRARFVGIESTKSAELDVKFAAAAKWEDLPTKLSDTDLISFDSATLARYGVVAYAPAYPLWSDDAGKLRHIRVPHGTSVQFDPQTQTFSIPPNTRFYKTFLKKVVDKSGKESYRKIETRLIVSRPDDCTVTPCKQTALFATYAWNDDETEAPLMTDTLRDGTPFGDRLLTYITDETKTGTDDGGVPTRHYGIPGSFRCIQCHMGSPSSSFVLGFTPLQINRKPYVEEPDMLAPGPQLKGYGVLQENAPVGDELTQLQRLIDYGIITGISSPDQVKSLKEAEQVPPRNGYELKAQSYMLGNCSHCHNPKGFPTVENPVLSNLLNFLPSLTGGIFGFPLDRTSPRQERRQDASIRIPYITPSLYDGIPVVQDQLDTDAFIHYSPKGYFNPLQTSPDAYEPPRPTDGAYYVLAPWRSFIYRNVDATFTYGDDYVIFPHMPLNTPGYDCRAPRILGDWMVSIPARRVVPATGPVPDEWNDLTTEIPYVEVKSDEPQYVGAVLSAKTRLSYYHTGERYNYCPDTSDIVDPRVVAGLASSPAKSGLVMRHSTPEAPWVSGVPDRAHWTNTDITNTTGPWSPRRSDWKELLLKHDLGRVKDPDEAHVIGLLSHMQIDSDFKTFALHETPFAFWSHPEQCAAQLAGEPTIASLPEAGRPSWWPFYRDDAKLHPRAPGDAGTVDINRLPLYSIAPGAAIFQNICINCHGTQADGQSSLGATILQMTGGETRVADLRDGLFGPPGQPGTARQSVFGKDAAEHGLGTDDVALRYLLWMALGGTNRDIPTEALTAVGNTLIAGQKRNFSATIASLASPNMLATARALCQAAVLHDNSSHVGSVKYSSTAGYVRDPNVQNTMLIESTGDGELWRQICSRGQKSPVHMLVSSQEGLIENDVQEPGDTSGHRFQKLYDPDAYGDNPVMTPNGVSQHGVTNGDVDTWCFDGPPSFSQGIPLCPDPSKLNPPRTSDDVLWYSQKQTEYSIRGAMNAGEAVFVYLDALARPLAEGGVPPTLQYNQCDKLTSSP